MLIVNAETFCDKPSIIYITNVKNRYVKEAYVEIYKKYGVTPIAKLITNKNGIVYYDFGDGGDFKIKASYDGLESDDFNIKLTCPIRETCLPAGAPCLKIGTPCCEGVCGNDGLCPGIAFYRARVKLPIILEVERDICKENRLCCSAAKDKPYVIFHWMFCDILWLFMLIIGIYAAYLYKKRITKTKTIIILLLPIILALATYLYIGLSIALLELFVYFIHFDRKLYK